MPLPPVQHFPNLSLYSLQEEMKTMTYCYEIHCTYAPQLPCLELLVQDGRGEALAIDHIQNEDEQIKNDLTCQKLSLTVDGAQDYSRLWM